jgi:ArsR family transcriptional regulator
LELTKLNPKELGEYAELLKVLGHPVRLCIVRGLLETKGCNVSKIQDCLELPQSTVSQHLAKLKSARIIEGERNGLEIIYKVVDNRTVKVLTALFK